MLLFHSEIVHSDQEVARADMRQVANLLETDSRDLRDGDVGRLCMADHDGCSPQPM